MASIPVYGSQYIRFQETFPNVGAAAVPAHRVVAIDQDAAGGPELVVVSEAAGATFTHVGVNQFEILAEADTSAAQGVRVAGVATAGLLLIEADTANAPAAGADLTVDNVGRVSDVGALGTNHFAVVIDGKTPTIRKIEGDFALVSFG